MPFWFIVAAWVLSCCWVIFIVLSKYSIPFNYKNILEWNILLFILYNILCVIFSAVVDKRGRNINQIEKEDLKKFYDIEDSDNGKLTN